MNCGGGDWPRGRFRDGSAKQLGEAGIAPVIHVQAILRHEHIKRKMLGVMPVAHHGEALEQIDILFFRGDRNLLDHAGVSDLASTAGANCGSMSTTSAPVAFNCSMPSCSWTP